MSWGVARLGGCHTIKGAAAKTRFGRGKPCTQNLVRGKGTRNAAPLRGFPFPRDPGGPARSRRSYCTNTTIDRGPTV